MRGWLRVIGLGPGAEDLLAPRAAAALAAASDIAGYHAYLDRVPARAGQRRHASDNGDELARARASLARAAAGGRVALVSGGDAGVFGMASAVFEAIEQGEAGWRTLDVEIIPGVSALLAAAAAIGAPLGHDFCVISLSDRLKPWDSIARRLAAAAAAGFVIVLYNPASRARREQFPAALALLRDILPGAVPVAFASAISRPEQRLDLTTLAEADPARADMRTLVMIGSAATRRLDHAAGAWLYTPRAERSA